MEQTILCRFDDRSLAQICLSHLSTMFDCSSTQLADGTILLECAKKDSARIVERLAYMGAAWVRMS